MWRSANDLIDEEIAFGVFDRAKLDQLLGAEQQAKKGTRSYTPHVNYSDPPHVNRLKTTCRRGHPYDDVNTYRRPNGARECRACRHE